MKRRVHAMLLSPKDLHLRRDVAADAALRELDIFGAPASGCHAFTVPELRSGVTEKRCASGASCLTQTANPLSTATQKPHGKAAISDSVDAYFSGLRRAPLSREEEVEVGKRIERAERDLLAALLETRSGRGALADVCLDLRAGNLPLDEVLRNVAQSQKGANTQRTKVLRVLATLLARDVPPSADPSTKAPLERLVKLRLHPNVAGRLEAAAQEAGELDGPRVRRARREIAECQRILVESNLRLVVSFARRYHNAHLALLDMIQEGNLGLMRAVEKYDYKSGCRLGTYASWWIRQAIERSIHERAPTIRVPVHLVESRRKLLRARAELRRVLGVEPTAKQLAEKTGLPVTKIELIFGLAHEPTSLDAPITADGETVVGELVANERSTVPEDEVGKAMLAASTRGLLEELSERERRVLAMRFGLGGEQEHTLEEIGVTLSLTRERIRQIEHAALKKLRQKCEERAIGLEAA